MKVQVIGNPIAGGGKAPKLIDALSDELTRLGCRVDTKLTQRAGDARRWCEGLPPDTDRLVVVGGDGTLNEAINGLKDPAATPIAQLPLGTANIIARELKLNFEPKGVAAAVVQGKVRRLDLCLAEREQTHGTSSHQLRSPGTDTPNKPHRFLAVASSGFDAMVTRDIMKHRKGSLGFRGYVKPVLRTVMRYLPPTLDVTVDGETLRGAMVIVSNIRNYAGFFEITRKARPDSGVFEVCVFPQGSRTALMMYSAAALTHTISKTTNAQFRTGSEIRIAAGDDQKSVPVELDGDYFCEAPIALSIQPGALAMVVPN